MSDRLSVSYTSDVKQDRRREWYGAMLEIRLFEEKVHQLFLAGDILGTVQLCQGQEAVAVGAIAAIRPDDYVTVTYRGHGQALAKGLGMESAFAELMGRATGCCGGVGGSMHLADINRGLLGSFAIVGAGLPVAVGAAMSAKLRMTDQIAVSFCGDGATNIGTFHEALNMAAVWKAPAVFIVENNLYGEYSPVRRTTPIDDLADRATAYGIPGLIVDGQDVVAVHDAVRGAVRAARAGSGPTLIEAKTYRYRGHARTDPGHYRPSDEVERWLRRDPIELLGAALIEEGVLSDDVVVSLRREVQEAVDASADRARAGRYPDIEEVASYVYAE